MDERRAIVRLKEGDAGGLEPLVMSHQTRAMRAAYLIVHNRALAEDLVQAAFVRAYEKIARFDESRPFGPWFMKVVVNDSIKAATRRERTVRFEGIDDPVIQLADPGSGPHELAEEAEERRRVWAALKKLPPAQRAAALLPRNERGGDGREKFISAGHDQVAVARRTQAPLEAPASRVPRAKWAGDRGASQLPARPGRR
jgi:RNA polymerase sigma-70 factor, ECF subfamily